MTDNFEDIEHQETVHPDEAPPAPGVRSNLAEAWRTRPLFKLVVVMVIAALVVAVISAFFSGGKETQMSKLVNPPDIHEPPGGKASPYFIQQTKEAEKQRSKEALEKGTSSLPTPIGQPADINVTEKMDPMNELKSETEHLKQQLLQMQQQQIEEKNKAAAAAQVQAAPKAAPEQFDQSLSQAMQQQMRTLAEGWQAKPMKKVDFQKPGDKDDSQTVSTAGGVPSGLAGAPGAVDAAANPEENPDPKGLGDKSWFVPAGTISYAQLLTEANSDVPVPILALVVSGPLNGAKAVGSFQVASGLSDYLVMTFKSATLKGRQYKINAIALDPDTTLGGMATETDQRYFTRLILPAAAAFLQGFGQALGTPSTGVATNGTTTVITQAGAGIDQGMFTGLGQAAQTASSFFQDQANKVKPLVRIAPNTPFAMFFVDSVCDWKTCKTDTEKATAPVVPPQPGYPGYPYSIPTLPPGFPGSPGYGGANAAQPGSQNDVPYPNYATPSTGNRGLGSPLTGGYGGYGGFH